MHLISEIKDDFQVVSISIYWGGTKELCPRCLIRGGNNAKLSQNK